MVDRDLCGRVLGGFVARERMAEGGSGTVYRGPLGAAATTRGSRQPSLRAGYLIAAARRG